MKNKEASRREFLAGTGVVMAGLMTCPRLTAESQNGAATAPLKNRAAWMQEPRYAWGVMTHYLADWQARDHGLTMTPAFWNKLIDGFDVAKMAEDLESVGAGHYQISLGQNSGYYLAPNAAYDAITKQQTSKCSRRDLAADFYEALHGRDIKLMVYLPSGAPDKDEDAMKALEWSKGAHPNKEFQVKWERVIAEWSRKWGGKVAGWWFDGCYYPNTMYRSASAPNFTSFAAAARAGNPQSCLAFNPGVIYRIAGMSPEDDYTAGEIDKPEMASVRRDEGGLVDGVQIQMLSFLGERWGSGNPRFTTEQVIAYTKKIRDAGGGVTWDVPVETNGTITQPFLEQLAALGKAFPR